MNGNMPVAYFQGFERADWSDSWGSSRLRERTKWDERLKSPPPSHL